MSDSNSTTSPKPGDLIELSSSDTSKDAHPSPKPESSNPRSYQSPPNVASEPDQNAPKPPQQFQMNLPDLSGLFSMVSSQPGDKQKPDFSQFMGIAESFGKQLASEMKSKINIDEIVEKAKSQYQPDPQTQSQTGSQPQPQTPVDMLQTLMTGLSEGRRQFGQPSDNAQPPSPNSVEVRSRDSRNSNSESRVRAENTTRDQAESKANADGTNFIEMLSGCLQDAGNRHAKSQSLTDIISDCAAEIAVRLMTGDTNLTGLTDRYVAKIWELIKDSNFVPSSETLSRVLFGVLIGLVIGYYLASRSAPQTPPLSDRIDPVNSLPMEQVLAELGIVERRLPDGDRVYVRISDCQILSESEVRQFATAASNRAYRQQSYPRMQPEVYQSYVPAMHMPSRREAREPRPNVNLEQLVQQLQELQSQSSHVQRERVPRYTVPQTRPRTIQIPVYFQGGML